MSDILAAIADSLFGWTVITLILSWILAGSYPLFARSVSRSNALRGSQFTLVYGLLAPAAATVALIVLSLPTLAFPLINAHCHGGVCAPHSLHMSTETLEGIASVAAAVVALTVMGMLMTAQLVNSRQWLRSLKGLSQAGAPSYRVMDSNEPLAWCAGLLRPVVYVSSSLVNTLSKQELQLILAHENAHALRRDNLRKWLLHWATLCWPAPLKRRIRLDHSNYNERVCDVAAALGERSPVPLKSLIETLSHCQNQRYQQRQRINDLARELGSGSQQQGSAATLTLLFITVVVYITITISAIHFGHPLLEWLAS